MNQLLIPESTSSNPTARVPSNDKPGVRGDFELDDIASLKIEKAAIGRSSKKLRRRVLYLVILIVITIASYLGYNQVFSSRFLVETGTVTTVYPSQLFTLLNATGYVIPVTKAEVASKGAGRLEVLEVEEGSHVKQGQIIARLENQDVIATREQAAANVKVAKASLERAEAELKEVTSGLTRAENLINKKVITQEIYDTAVAHHSKAIAAVNSAKANILAAEAAYNGTNIAVEYTLIRAPFDGVVLTKHANVGDIVAPFASTIQSKGAVVTMADLDTLEVEADVSESSLHKVQPGQPCEIQLDAIPDVRFRGEVSRIVPTVDRAKATVLVRVRFVEKDGRILPNMSAKVAFLSQALTPEQQRPVTAVQPSAIVTNNGEPMVFLVHGNTVRKAPVETGERIGESIVVEQGLNPGDQVVLHPPEKLQDGSIIKVQHI